MELKSRRSWVLKTVLEEYISRNTLTKETLLSQKYTGIRLRVRRRGGTSLSGQIVERLVVEI